MIISSVESFELTRFHICYVLQIICKVERVELNRFHLFVFCRLFVK
jgi:hypothetical protein